MVDARLISPGINELASNSEQGNVSNSRTNLLLRGLSPVKEVSGCERAGEAVITRATPPHCLREHQQLGAFRSGAIEKNIQVTCFDKSISFAREHMS